jgi:cell division protein FtsW (lipid II flippase)
MQVLGNLRRYRWKELRLYIIPILILLLSMTQLLLADKDPHSSFSTKSLPAIQDLVPVLGLVGFLLATNILLSFSPMKRADQMLLPLVGLMSGIGMLMAIRLGPDVGLPSQGTRQLIWILAGIVLCMIVLFALRDMRWLRRYYYVWALLGVALVTVTLVNTLHVKNLDSPTHDQLNIGPINFQPSEFLKICIVIFFAAVLAENSDIFSVGNLRLGPFRLPPVRQLIPVLAMLFIALLLFLVVRELGLALLIYGLYLCMIYLGSGKFSYVAVGLVLFFLLGLVGYALFSYVRARFQAVGFNVLDWQNWTPAQTSFAENGGLQIVQGIIALCSGGILGAGLGLGHPAFVPVAQSDMVFTALGEEFGLAGLFGILGLYLLIIYRGYRIAIEASDPFSKLLAAGLTSIFAIQTFIITAGNMKFLPLTGIPLPFLSYGGSSIIANFMIIGILLRISYNNALEREGLAY